MPAPPPIDLLLLRHGEQEPDPGHDGRLTPRGVEQAGRLAEAVGLRDADRLVSSSLTRAVHTAQILGREPERVDELDEYRFGPRSEWPLDAHGGLVLWRPEHRAGVETLAEFQRRVEDALTTLFEPPPPPDGRLVVCVHSGVIDALLRWAMGCPPESPWLAEAEIRFASITELTHWPGGRGGDAAPRHTLVTRVGDVAHLPPELVLEG
jgi:broad specificity phosphatase PhoE